MTKKTEERKAKKDGTVYSFERLAGSRFKGEVFFLVGVGSKREKRVRERKDKLRGFCLVKRARVFVFFLVQGRKK